MSCQVCGGANDANARFCSQCGAQLVADLASRAPSATTSVRCVAGSESGKLYWIGAAEVALPPASSGISNPKVWLSWRDGVLAFRTAPDCALRVNGLTAVEGTMIAGQRFTLGESTWEIGPGQAGMRHLLDSISARLQHLASTDKLEGFSLSQLFSEVFKKHPQEEVDRYFTVGTSLTTPPIEQAQTGWPQPWFFMRVLMFVGVIYFGFAFAVSQFHNSNLIPGLIIMGSLAVPLATVILFLELNTPRNIAFHTLLTMFCLGGLVSLLVSLVGYSVSDLSWLGAPEAGIIEEAGKLIAVVLVVRHARYRYILNGMVFGAAVGAGFAVFESAGYAFNALLGRSGSVEGMESLIVLRAFLSPFGHVAWTAITAGALWRSRRGSPLSFNVLRDLRFWKACLIPVALHMIWDSPLPSFFYIKYLALGGVSWFVVFGLVQQGLRQVLDEKLAAAREAYTDARMMAAGAQGA